MKNPMRNFFQRVLWDRNMDKKALSVKYISRGAPLGVEQFTGEDVRGVTRDGVVIEVEGEEKFIPFHRILEITYLEGKVIYSKKDSIYNF